jgi:hypothetical protein
MPPQLEKQEQEHVHEHAHEHAHEKPEYQNADDEQLPALPATDQPVD